MSTENMGHSFLIPPHQITSREVLDTKTDLRRIEEDGFKMFKSLTMAHGVHRLGGYAIAHSQVTDQDPLRFFVMKNKVIVNPVIINHVQYKVKKYEGCLSFPEARQFAEVMRYHKITVEYQTVIEDKDGVQRLSSLRKKFLSGLEAQIWQHEIDHFNVEYIYPILSYEEIKKRQSETSDERVQERDA